MTSRNRMIAEVAVHIQALATRLGNIVYDENEAVSVKDIKHIPGDLQKVVYSLLELLDCEDDGDVGLTD